MEKALEKARQGGDVRSTHGKAPPPSGIDAPPAFDYQQTRVEPVPAQILRKNRVIAGFAHDPYADIFRMLRAQTLKYLTENGGTTIGICSPNPGVGKSFVSANLAVSLALGIDHTVLLVDADFRRPSLSSYFGLAPGPGLTDYLLRDTELSECLVNPGIDRVVLLPVGTPVQNSSEILGSPKMLKLANELQTRYSDRLIVYDLPPLLTGDDSLVFLPRVDGCMLVIEERRTRVQELQRSLELISDARLIGTVLNKSSSSTIHHYYY